MSETREDIIRGCMAIRDQVELELIAKYRKFGIYGLPVRQFYHSPKYVAEILSRLPQHLKNRILDEVVEWTPEEVVVINEEYRPPPMLQINRETRKRAAEAFYGGAVFRSEDRGLWEKWLRSLTVENREMIKREQAGEESVEEWPASTL